MKKVTIYALECPVNNTVNYIGQTTDILIRIKDHCKPSNQKKTAINSKWIKSLSMSGLKPRVLILDEVNYEDRGFWESHYVSLFLSWGFVLNNETFGGNEKGRASFKEKVSKGLIGKPCSESKKISISTSNKGRIQSESEKSNRRGSQKCNPVIQIDFAGNIIKEFASIKETKKDGFMPCFVGMVARGVPKYNSHKGFKWRLKNDTGI